MYDGSPSTSPTSSSTRPFSKPTIGKVRPKHFSNSSLVPIPSGRALGTPVMTTRSPIFIGRPHLLAPCPPPWSLLHLRVAPFGLTENLFLGIANAELRL